MNDLPADEQRFFATAPAALMIWAAIRGFAVALPGTQVRVQKSQIGLVAGHAFAAVWVPGQHLPHPVAPLVLSVFARQRLEGKWREVVEAAPGRFSHHAGLQGPEDFAAWLRAAMRAAHAGAVGAKNG